MTDFQVTLMVLAGFLVLAWFAALGYCVGVIHGFNKASLSYRKGNRDN